VDKMGRAILIVIALASFSFGQIEQGTYQVGGGFSFQTGSEKNEGTKIDRTIWTINPSVSYFFIDNLSVGLGVSYSSSTSSSKTIGDDEANSFYFGPVLKYFLSLNETTFPFLLAAYSHSNGKWHSKSSYSNSNFFRISDKYVLGAGIAIFLTDFLSFEPILTYERSIRVFDNKYSQNQFGGGLINNHDTYQSDYVVFAIGVSYYIK
jgi:Outer membrane protein beta-barrel domain